MAEGSIQLEDEMTHIMGVVCDGCGKNDVISATVASSQSVPRRNWISLSFWSGEDKGAVRSPEVHVCGVECLQTVIDKLFESSQNALNEDKTEE